MRRPLIARANPRLQIAFRTVVGNGTLTMTPPFSIARDRGVVLSA